jgi:predicted phosphoadenosine phosphosulfate sulfurtransferase
MQRLQQESVAHNRELAEVKAELELMCGPLVFFCDLSQYSNTWLNWPPSSPPYWAGQTKESDEPPDFISEIMKFARHFRPFQPQNRINRGRFDQVLLYLALAACHSAPHGLC